MSEVVVDSSNKIITNNPFLDELLYNCKSMALGTILKDQTKADENETEESMTNFEIYRSIKENSATYNMFEYTEDMIRTLPISESMVLTYFNNQDKVPSEYRNSLLELGKAEFLKKYQELNNYYRMISGLPDYGSVGFYLNDEDIPELYRDIFDTSKPIHNYTNSQIELLNNMGVMDKLKKQYPSLKYLNYLGNNSIDSYTARMTERFGILYVPDPLSPYSETLYNKFVELLDQNRKVILKTVYSSAYALKSEHYNDYISIMIITNALADMVTYLPESMMKLEFYDLKSIKYYFESRGVTFFEDIPLKYQIKLCKNLNKIIKNKASDQLILDVASIFGMDEIILYKYYLIKRHVTNEDSNSFYIEDESLDKKYELKFVKVPIEDNLQKYINSTEKYDSFNDVVSADPYWAGDESTYEEVKNQLLKEDFSVKRSEYLALGATVDVTQNSMKNSYFMNILFDATLNNDALTLSVPSINSTAEFKLLDIFCLMYALTYEYYGSTDNIMSSPSQILTMFGFNFEDNMIAIKQDLYNKKYYSIEDLENNGMDILEGNIHGLNYLKEDMEKNNYTIKDIDSMSNKIIGFNFDTSVDDMNDILHKKGYSLEKIGIPELEIPEDFSILTYKQLAKIYTTNKNIRDLLVKQIRDADNYRLRQIYIDIYNAWMIRDYNTKVFTIAENKVAKTFTEFLKYRSSVLYEYLMNIKAISNTETRNQEIQGGMSNIIAALEQLITMDDFESVIIYFPFSDIYSIRGYILEIVSYFKSVQASIVGADTQNNMEYPYDSYIKCYEYFGQFVVSSEKTEGIIPTDKMMNMKTHFRKNDEIKSVEIPYFNSNIEIEKDYSDSYIIEEEVQFRYFKN